MAILLPLPGTVVLMGIAILFAFASSAASGRRRWRCCRTPPSPASTRRWPSRSRTSPGRLGHLVGAGAGGAVAEVTSDAVPYAALGVITAVTLAGVTVMGRRQPRRLEQLSPPPRVRAPRRGGPRRAREPPERGGCV